MSGVTVTFDPPQPVPMDGVFDHVPPSRPVELAAWDVETRCWFRVEYRRLRSILSPLEARIILRLRADTMHRICVNALRAYVAPSRRR